MLEWVALLWILALAKARKLMKGLLAGLSLVLMAANLFAKTPSASSSPDAAAAAAAATGLAGIGFACCFLYLLFLAGCLVEYFSAHGEGRGHLTLQLPAHKPPVAIPSAGVDPIPPAAVGRPRPEALL